MKFRIYPLLLLLCLLVATNVFAEDKGTTHIDADPGKKIVSSEPDNSSATKAPTISNDSPIYIEADNMESTEDSNSVIFRGAVIAKQADIKIKSRVMTVYYTQKNANNGEDKPQQVDRLICTDNVEVSRGEWLGTGDKMIYIAKDKKIVLTGDAKAWQGQNLVTGSKITYYLNDKRSEVEGAGKGQNKKNNRVNMTIIQK